MPEPSTMIFGTDTVTRDPNASPTDTSNAAYIISPFAPGSSINTAGTGVSSSSGTATNAVNNLGGTISGSAAAPPVTPTGPDNTSINAASADAQKILKDQQTALENRRIQAIADIETSFGASVKSTEAAQKQETGSTGMGMARIGGFDSLSGQGTLTNLANTQRAEIQTLKDKRQQAINQAQSAYDDKSFDLAYKIAQGVKDLDNEIHKRGQDYTDNLNKAAREASAQAYQSFQMNQALKKDLQGQEKIVREFNVENKITTPFYVVGGTIFNSQTLKPVTMEEYRQVTGTDQLDPKFISEPQSKLKAGDTEITVVGGRKKLINSITGETIKDLGSSGSGTLSTKSPQVTDMRKYDLPSWVSLSDFNIARDELLKTKKENNVANMSDTQRYDAWGKSADYMKNVLGLDPQDFDGLLWETFSPEGLAGYRQHVQNVKPKANSVEQLTASINEWLGKSQ